MRASVSADGKRLVFLRWAESPVVYISEIQQGGSRLSPLRLSASMNAEIILIRGRRTENQ